MDSLRGPVVEAAGISTAITRKSHACSSFSLSYHAADVMRFLGGTYTGEHRIDHIDETVRLLTSLDIDPWLIAQYIRAITVGCPNHFVAETTHENALLHWREGTHPSITKYMVEVLNVMAKRASQ